MQYSLLYAVVSAIEADAILVVAVVDDVTPVVAVPVVAVPVVDALVVAAPVPAVSLAAVTVVAVAVKVLRRRRR